MKAEEEMTRECEDLHDMIDYRCGDIEELSCILEEREELLEQVRDALSILKEIA